MEKVKSGPANATYVPPHRNVKESQPHIAENDENINTRHKLFTSSFKNNSVPLSLLL